MTGALSKSLGVFRGAALLLNIVIGAGLLTLPGLAIQQAGDRAFGAWVMCAVTSMPLLAVFIILGKRFPEAGGVTAYAFRGFGAMGRSAATVLFLGAVSLGLPAIALTGGHYLATFLGGSPHAYAIGMVLCGVLLHGLPGEGVATAMTWIASAIIAAVITFLIIGALGLLHLPADTSARAHYLTWSWGADGTFMMLFFAFTGWEVGAGIAEEFRNPKVDYPLAMILSFCLATVLYLCSAFIAQSSDLTGSYEAPFVAMTKPVLGSHAASLVALVAALIVLANLGAAIWGVSRLVFGLARDGSAPAVLAATVGGKPLAAVIVISTVIATVIVLDGVGFFGLAQLLTLAGQNFLIIYGIVAGALIALARSNLDRFLGSAVVALVMLLIVQQGQSLAYPAALVIGAAVLTWVRQGKFSK